MMSTTQTSIKIGWTEPESNGCPITGFSVFRDTGITDDIDEEVDPLLVNDKPSLREYDVTSLSPTSSTFRFKIRVYNSAGYTDSNPLSVVLAGVPEDPPSAPSSDTGVTDNSKIKVLYSPPLTYDNGGSEILSYELQMDNGLGGSFVSLIGYSSDSMETTYTITENIATGKMYRFRYRSRNVNGWSEFSPIAYIAAATVPLPPPAPTVSLVDETQVQLALTYTLDDGGSSIIEHLLYISAGITITTVTPVTYNGAALTKTINVGDVFGAITITTGQVYSFVY